MGQPVPTNSWVSHIVWGLHVSTMSVPPERSSSLSGRKNELAVSPRFTEISTIFFCSSKPACSSAHVVSVS